ncbi:unnamed protein product [Blepharisma stoltei]|uniref:Uncharacterized protein n=1 Tax=Blepharisma stoltei TaxID=1481888 RepID=A0AAU9IW43_9CILI|nr:unnamed protein product [Blepharisma stoltei]
MMDPVLISVRSQQNPSSVSKRSLLSSSIDSAQEEAYKSTLKNLEEKIRSAVHNEKELQILSAKEKERELQLKSELKLKNKSNALELERQINEKKNRLLKEKEEFKVPGISEDFHGYPNIPETPKQLRRERELAIKRGVKKDLTLQIQSKTKELEQQKAREKELDLDFLSRAKQSLDIEKELKKDKKLREKELLTSYWNQEIKAKELKKNFERAARGQKIKNNDIIIEDKENEEIEIDYKSNDIEEPPKVESPIIPKQKEEEKIEVDDIYRSLYIKKLENLLEKKSSDTKSIVSTYSKFDKRQKLLNKAMQIKAKIDQQTQRNYQEKIKNMINQAKRHRNRFSNSVSPGFSPIPRYSSLG